MLSCSGSRASTAPVEDGLCVYIKDERWLEHIVTIDMIIEEATELMSEAIGARTPEVMQSGSRPSCAVAG